MNQRPELSIGIVNYNTRDLLQGCLKSIAAEPHFGEYEVIVVDNASSDGSLAMLASDFPAVHVVANEQNRGYAAAVNQFIKICRGAVLLVLNADIAALDGAIDKTLNFLHHHEDAGFVGCRVLNPDRSLQRSCRGFPNWINFLSENFYLYALFPKVPLFGAVFMTHFNYQSEREVDVILGAFLMVRRRVIEQIGAMDDQFFMYAEETDWCYRAKQAGYRNLFFPGAEIIHYGEQSTRQNSVAMFIELHKSHHKYIRKYHGAAYRMLVKIILVFGVILRLLFGTVGVALARLGFRRFAGAAEFRNRYLQTLLWYFTSATGSH